MPKDHPEIWLGPQCEDERCWASDCPFDPCEEHGHEPVRYVRGDLYDAARREIAALRAKLAERGE